MKSLCLTPLCRQSPVSCCEPRKHFATEVSATANSINGCITKRDKTSSNKMVAIVPQGQALYEQCMALSNVFKITEHGLSQRGCQFFPRQGLSKHFTSTICFVDKCTSHTSKHMCTKTNFSCTTQVFRLCQVFTFSSIKPLVHAGTSTD